jgi:hypothetical protein
VCVHVTSQPLTQVDILTQAHTNKKQSSTNSPPFAQVNTLSQLAHSIKHSRFLTHVNTLAHTYMHHQNSQHPLTTCTLNQAQSPSHTCQYTCTYMHKQNSQHTQTPHMRPQDFGFRGCTSVEQSIMGGTAHLLSFTGSDTMSASYYAQVRGAMCEITLYLYPVMGSNLNSQAHYTMLEEEVLCVSYLV